jgi:hypothetical protein
VYKNTGSGFDEDVTASSVLTGVFYSSAAWGDYDNDGDLDILLTGGGKSFKPLAFVYRNNSATANMPPGVPGGLLSRQISDHQVSLSWEAPTPNTYTTPYSGLTYNLRVGTSPGLSDTLTPMSCVGSCGISGDGYRQIPMMGAANHGLTATLELPYGEYYWSVQAVDHTFAGSPWSKEERFFMLWMVELEINLDGDGSGSINSDPTGISCGSDCQEEYPYGTVVTLTASPEAGSIFSGWSGDCSGSGVCQVVMNDIKNVTAIFEIGNSNYLPVVKR